MSDLKDILGNETLKEHFKTAVRHKKVSHAYIIEGEKGSGKKMFAEAFAKILQCEQGGEEACGQCASCIQMEHRDHPDVIRVIHEKPNVISVHEMREQVVNTIDIKPYKGPYKIYIIDEAEKMNNAAQNAILKTIEEPPSYAVVLLLTTNRGAFLPTILSRCILLNVKPVEEHSVQRYLMDQFHIPKETAEFCAGYSMGNIGKAKDAALSEEFLEIRNFNISVLQYIYETEDYEIIEKVKTYKKWKDSINECLDMMLMWFRDILLIKVMGNDNKLIFKENYSIIKKQSEILTLESIEEILKKIDQARMRIKANVNFDTSLELLLMEIKQKFIQNNGGYND